MNQSTEPPLDDVPLAIAQSRLWKRVSSNVEYSHVLLEIRKVAGIVASKVSSTLPEYTDHSIKHMDYLWRLAGQILKNSEIDILSEGEAFLLGASFYVHDLGMALAVTNEGLENIESTPEYRAAFTRFKTLHPLDELSIARLAMKEAVRELHAKRALELATVRLPGLDRFLIEESEFRDKWAHMLGQIAESHHWSLEQVERSLGARKAVPSPDGETLDLGYISCLLRVIDFAH